MSKHANSKSRSKKPVGYKLGWRASTHISNVEGQVMSRDMHDTFVMFENTQMTPEQRRKALREKYGNSA